MRTSLSLLLQRGLCAAAPFLFGPVVLQAQETDPNPWMAYLMPGPDHAAFEPYEGLWKEEVTIWMDPATEPQRFAVDCAIRLALDGRFLEFAHSGLLGGRPFGGLDLLGHNNASKQFELVGVSNLGTGTLMMHGGWKEPGRSIELKGTMASPLGGTVNVRQVVTFGDKDTLLIEQFDQHPGSAEYRSIEHRFTRKP